MKAAGRHVASPLRRARKAPGRMTGSTHREADRRLAVRAAAMVGRDLAPEVGNLEVDDGAPPAVRILDRPVALVDFRAAGVIPGRFLAVSVVAAEGAEGHRVGCPVDGC